MANQRLILDSPEAVEIARPLFPESVAVCYCNGHVPEEWRSDPDVTVFGRESEWVASSAGQLSSPKIRAGEGDITEIDRAEPGDWLRARIQPYTPDPAPQAEPLPAPPPFRVGEPPAEAGLSGSDLSDSAGDWTQDIPDAEENVLRSIRVASELKKHAFQSDGPGEWAEPADFWNATPLPEFPPDCLPPEIAPYVMDNAARAGVDPAQVALYCYTACAALIRSDIDLQMQEDSGEDGRTWRERAILWGAVVGDPSTGKGPTADIALHKFYKIASALRMKDEAAWEQYDKDSKVHERRMQSWYAEQAKSKTDLLEPVPPTKPPRERLWTDDVTKEVVAKLLCENPRGKIAIIKDELASWFGGFDAYGNGKSDKDRPDWLSFYESRERYVDRAMEGRSYHVPSWGGVILGGIQPEVLAKISGKLGADGMLQRFQLILAKPKRKGEKRAPDAEAARQWNRIQENLADMRSSGRSVQLSPEAAQFMDAQGEWIENAMLAGLAPSLVAALGKWPGLFGRLMLVSHCIESASHGMQHPAAFVSLRTAEQVWRWLRGLLWPHALHFYTGQLDQGEEFTSIRSFAEFCMARDVRSIKPYALSQKWSHYRVFKTIQSRREFWARVQQSGWARPVGIVDRATSIAGEYEINPLAFDGRFSAPIVEAKSAVVRRREATHPEFWRAQNLEPGQD